MNIVAFLRKSSAESLSFWNDSISDLLARIINRVGEGCEPPPGGDESAHEPEELEEPDEPKVFGAVCNLRAATFVPAPELRPVTITVTVSSPLKRRMWLAFLRAAVRSEEH